MMRAISARNRNIEKINRFRVLVFVIPVRWWASRQLYLEPTPPSRNYELSAPKLYD
jgi:hypothetical protein